MEEGIWFFLGGTGFFCLGKFVDKKVKSFLGKKEVNTEEKIKMYGKQSINFIERKEKEMKKLLTITVAALMLIITGTIAEAGTLDRGVSIGFFIGAGANSNPLDNQMKYQMAIDSLIGIKNKYRSIYTTNVYHNDSYDNHNTIISVDAEIGQGEIILNTNPNIFNDSSSQTTVTVGANIGEGQITLNTGNNP